jgi:hypothetical protein
MVLLLLPLLVPCVLPPPVYGHAVDVEGSSAS